MAETMIPRPTTTVETNDGNLSEDRLRSISVSISREGSSQKKTYQTTKSNEIERTKEIVEQIIGDGYTAEWLP